MRIAGPAGTSEGFRLFGGLLLKGRSEWTERFRSLFLLSRVVRGGQGCVEGPDVGARGRGRYCEEGAAIHAISLNGNK